MKHISGENFAALADDIYKPGAGMPDRGLIYCHINHVLQAFAAMRARKGPYVLISSQGDFYTTPNYLSALPDNLIRWFTVGAAPHPKVEGIPLGLADSCYDSGNFDHGQWKVMEAEIMRYCPFDERQLLHVCLCLTTNQDRVNAVAAVRDWANCKTYLKFEQRLMPFRAYLADLHEHQFTLSPPGGGFDCHRIWEALYLGVIPICIRHDAYHAWEGRLPICFVDQWTQITPDFLKAEAVRLRAQPSERQLLTMPYWRDRIRSFMPRA